MAFDDTELKLLAGRRGPSGELLYALDIPTYILNFDLAAGGTASHSLFAPMGAGAKWLFFSSEEIAFAARVDSNATPGAFPPGLITNGAGWDWNPTIWRLPRNDQIYYLHLGSNVVQNISVKFFKDA